MDTEVVVDLDFQVPLARPQIEGKVTRDRPQSDLKATRIRPPSNST